MTAQAGSGARVVHRLVLGRGPLKRRSDRLECVSRLLVLLVVLCAVPVALAAATQARSAAAEAALHQAAHTHPVDAVLTATTTDVTLGGAGDRQWTAARWTGPDGLPHTGVVSAPVGAVAGQHVPAWVDDEGVVTRAPMGSRDVVDRALLRGLLVFLGACAAALLGHLAFCGLLWRRRAARWSRDWAAVEPVWAARR